MNKQAKTKDFNDSLSNVTKGEVTNGRVYLPAAVHSVSFEMQCSFLSTSDIDPNDVNVNNYVNGFDGSPEGSDVIEF